MTLQCYNRTIRVGRPRATLRGGAVRDREEWSSTSRDGRGRQRLATRGRVRSSRPSARALTRAWRRSRAPQGPGAKWAVEPLMQAMRTRTRTMINRAPSGTHWIPRGALSTGRRCAGAVAPGDRAEADATPGRLLATGVLPDRTPSGGAALPGSRRLDPDKRLCWAAPPPRIAIASILCIAAWSGLDQSLAKGRTG